MTAAPKKKTGRPKLSPSEKRTKVLFVRLNPAQHRKFKLLAAAEGMPPTYVALRAVLQWMRQAEERAKRAGIQT